MVKLIAMIVVMTSMLVQADDVKVNKTITDSTGIAITLTNLITEEKQGLIYRFGEGHDFTALSLAGYRVLKITFSKPLNDKGLCQASLTFNKPAMDGKEFIFFKGYDKNSNTFNVNCN